MAMGWIFSEYDLKNEAMNYSANVLRRWIHQWQHKHKENNSRGGHHQIAPIGDKDRKHTNRTTMARTIANFLLETLKVTGLASNRLKVQKKKMVNVEFYS
jgi:transposase-like protein